MAFGKKGKLKILQSSVKQTRFQIIPRKKGSDFFLFFITGALKSVKQHIDQITDKINFKEVFSSAITKPHLIASLQFALS